MRSVSTRNALQRELTAGQLLARARLLKALRRKIQRHRYQMRATQQRVHRVELRLEHRVILVRSDRSEGWTQPAIDGGCGALKRLPWARAI
jgi:hypothetical protein